VDEETGEVTLVTGKGCEEHDSVCRLQKDARVNNDDVDQAHMREGGDAGETLNDDDHPRTDDRRRREG
jgi:hypothetical protein